MWCLWLACILSRYIGIGPPILCMLTEAFLGILQRKAAVHEKA